MANDEILIAIKAVDDASAALKNVSASLKGVDDQAKKTADGFSKLDAAADKMKGIGSKLSIGVTLPIAGIAVAATKAASDLSETTNKIDTLFGTSSQAIKEWSRTSATALGQSRKQALDAAADFAVFGKAAGLAGDDLVKFAESNTQLASDMASFFNTSPEEAIVAIGAAFRGESEPIRRYGVLLNEASLKDEALRMGLIKTTSEALQPQQRVLAAQALIMKQTSAAQGDFAKTSDGLANSTRIVNAQLQDTLATLGEKLLPVALKGATALKDLLTAFTSLPAPMQDAIIAFAGIAAAAGPVLTIGGNLVSVFGKIKGNIPGLVGGLRDFSTVLKGLEFSVIIAGLAAIVTYLDRVGKAANATADDLIAMSKSGDVFDQAAASTEILLNGQERLKKTLDDVNAELIASKRPYSDYRASIEATAKAAGYQIDAQGNLVQIISGMAGQTVKLIDANYALSESEYELANTGRSRGEVAAGLLGQLLDLGRQAEQYNAALQGTAQAERDNTDALGSSSDALDRHYAALAATAQATQEAADKAKEAAEAEAIHRGSIADSIAANEKLAQSLAKATDAQATQMLAQSQLDTLKKAYEEGKITQDAYTKAIDAVLLRYELATPKSLAMADAQDTLNKAFLDGQIPLDNYINATSSIPRIAEDGKVSLSELAELGLKPTTEAAGEQKTQVDELSAAWGRIPANVKTVYTIEVRGDIPTPPAGGGGIPGAARGADFIVPPNPYGGAGDYFPVLAAPGERVTVQTKAQQNSGAHDKKAGDTITYTYNTNVYNPLAAAMLADKQRRDRVARSNARMGVT